MEIDAVVLRVREISLSQYGVMECTPLEIGMLKICFMKIGISKIHFFECAVGSYQLSNFASKETAIRYDAIFQRKVLERVGIGKGDSGNFAISQGCIPQCDVRYFSIKKLAITAGGSVEATARKRCVSKDYFIQGTVFQYQVLYTLVFKF